jgi:hypothetical protein
MCVNNTSAIDPGIDDVRRLIDSKAKGLPGYGDVVPLSWLRFLDRAMDVRKTGKKSFISLSEARELAAANEIDEGRTGSAPQTKLTKVDGSVQKSSRELMLLLNLFTDLGMLMHFDTVSLRDMVVLNTQWILDVMCELVCLRSMGEKLKRANSTSPDWRRLRRSGRLELSLLPDIWPEFD